MGLVIRDGIDLAQLKVKALAALPDALQHGMEHIGEVSAQQTPIEEGTLVRSQKIEVDAENKRASMSYAGPYARYQHEKLELRHEHGNAKYLEIPLVTEYQTALGIIAQDIKAAL